MININLEAAREFAIQANRYINSDASENVLRHLCSAYLPQMFPDNPWWIQEHSKGAEAHVHYIDTKGLRRTGFIDSLVGKTAIEYEKNLSIKTIYEEGYHQVKKYCAALLNEGNSCDDIIGVLSDTVRWLAFRVRIEHVLNPGLDYSPEDITLEQIDAVNLQDTSDYNLKLFELFINRYLGREGSRRLDPTVLAMDMGFDSVFYYQHIKDFRNVVNAAFSSRAYYGNMIASLWQNFVCYLEDNGEQTFNRNVYTNELYMITLAKLLCANILNEAYVPCDEATLKNILNGQWFKEKGFVNIVEYDYFGWLNETPFVNDIVSIAQRMQKDLAAYDYSNVETEDLFGPLLAQLADKDRRLLLGQEFTPQWLAEKIVSHAIERVSDDKYLVMAGAGGGYTCAAYIQIARLSKDKTIIDQTLYWYIAQSEDEALYITGLLNSQALDTIIADFQPEGALGRRHVHKLPYAVTPPFDADNPSHLLVVEKTRALKKALDNSLPSSEVFEYCSPARSNLSVRRRRFRLFIQQLPESRDYEDACRGVFNV